MIDYKFLDEAQKASLATRIAAAESRTRGEIVTVIAGASDSYRYIPTLWAALAALSVPGLYYLFEHFSAGGWQHPIDGLADPMTRIYPIQALVFLGLGMLFQIPAIRLWLVPRSIRRQRAARHAREQFFLQKLHRTELASGILIFVSVAEHYVEIIVDDGIAAKVDEKVWDETIVEFVALVRKGRIHDGFESAIEHCRKVLWEHFPAPEGRPDELPNHLIEV